MGYAQMNMLDPSAVGTRCESLIHELEHHSKMSVRMSVSRGVDVLNDVNQAKALLTMIVHLGKGASL